MGRRQQHLPGAARQHHLAGVEHHHPVTDPGNGTQIVADIDHGRAGLAVDVAQQLQNMRLRRHVQPGGGFVKQQHIGFARQRHGNCHPLLLATRELMRVAGRNGLGLRQTHLAQQFGHTVGVLGRWQCAVQRHCFQQLPTHTQRRSQRLAGILRHQRHLAATDRFQGRPRQAEHLVLTKMHAAAHHLQTGFQVAHGRQGQRAFARTALTHQADGLAAPDLEVDVAQDRQHGAGPAGKADAQVSNIKQGHGVHLRSAPSERGPRPAFWPGHRP